MASDLLGIGSSGLLAQQKMLATTSSNISNVSTQGYSRQNTVLSSNQNTLGVGNSTTRRMLDVYAQSEVWRDTATYNQVNTNYSELSQLDKYLSDSATSLSDGIDSFFTSLQSANSSPNTASSRQGIMGQISTIIDRFQSVSTQLTQQYDGINSKLDTEVTNVNTMLSSINDLNSQILKQPASNDDGTRANLLDQRDELIRQLSEKLDIRTVSQSNGTTLVNLSSGESLVVAGSYAQLSTISGNPDPKNTQLQIKLGNASATVNTQTIGGTLGGYYSARDTITDTQRNLGQLSLAFSDAMNTQNKLGMTLNNTIGTNLFTLPTSSGLANSNNTGTGAITASVIPGQGSNVPPNDFQVTFTGANSFDFYMMDGNTKTLVSSGTTPPTTIQLANYGLQFDVSGSPSAGDSFLIQPARTSVGSVSSNITRAEDLALASPLKLNASSSNYSTATISLTGVYNTDSATSAFTSSGLSAAAPQQVLINSSGDYEIYDGNSPKNLLATVPASSNGSNLLAASGLYASVQTYPGYELSIDGVVKPGDSFNVSFNTDGFSDNKNGLALAGLQTQDLVRKGNSTAADNKMTFNEAFSSTLTDVGTIVSGLKTSVTAADAKLTQSQQLSESISGVNLDEEAANLVRYQQAYAASAKVITAAKDTFDTLLSAVK
jgi:flagellar hook-associated protein FlgK